MKPNGSTVYPAENHQTYEISLGKRVRQIVNSQKQKFSFAKVRKILMSQGNLDASQN